MSARQFAGVLCDPRNDEILADAVLRGARTHFICMLERGGIEHEHMMPGGRLIHHLPLDTRHDNLLETFGDLAEHLKCSTAGQTPTVYPTDRALQLAHSRIRDWRGSAASLGALSVAAIVPCADPPDLTIGLGMWAWAVRELWLRHHVLPVLHPEGDDPAAVEQLSSLLGEVPHIRAGGNMSVLERAAVLARIDAVIAAGGLSAQLALAQNTPTVIVGSDYRRRLFEWSRSRLCYVLADGTGRSGCRRHRAGISAQVSPATRIRVAS